MSTPETFSPAYRLVIDGAAPICRLWGRLQVEGLEHLPLTGPGLIAANHDSYWDPIAIGVAARPRRMIRALAKAEMWKVPVVGSVLTGMGQIPIDRGKGDAGAMNRAIEELRRGAMIGVFPEGTRSRGRTLRPRSGLGRLAAAVPEAKLVCATVVGATDIARFPKRPALRVRFFLPEGGGLQPGEAPADFVARVLQEIRSQAPVDACGRRRRPIAA